MNFQSPARSFPNPTRTTTTTKKVLNCTAALSCCSVRVARGWRRGLRGERGRGGSGCGPRPGILSPRGAPGYPLQGSRTARPPRAPSEGSPRRLASSGCDRPRPGEMPRFASLQKREVWPTPHPVPKMGTGRGGCAPSLPRVPAAPRRLSPASPATAARPADLPAAPESPARAPTHLGRRPRWWRWSSRSPSRRWPGKQRSGAGGRGSWGRRRRRRAARPEPEAGGGRAGPGGGARDLPLLPQRGAGQGAAGGRGPGRKPPGTPLPSSGRGPRRTHPSPRQPRRRPIPGLLRTLRPGIGRREEGAGV